MKSANTFECDKGKARSNFQKHQLRFTEGCRIFDGHSLTAPRNQSEDFGEIRYTTIGVLVTGEAVVVVWTNRAGNVRVISVRKARRKERSRYYAHIQKTIN